LPNCCRARQAGLCDPKGARGRGVHHWRYLSCAPYFLQIDPLYQFLVFVNSHLPRHLPTKKASQCTVFLKVGLGFPYMQRIIRETGSVGRVTESLIQSSLCMCIHTGACTCLLVLEYIYCCLSLTWCSRATSTSLSIAIHTRPANREKSGYGPNVL